MNSSRDPWAAAVRTLRKLGEGGQIISELVAKHYLSQDSRLLYLTLALAIMFGTCSHQLA